MKGIAVAFAWTVSMVACRGREFERPQRVRVVPADAPVALQVVAPADAPAAPRGAAPPAQITRPTPPWPRGMGPSCPGYVSVSANRSLSCAVCSDGLVHCWGDMSSRLVRGATRQRTTDVIVIDAIT